MNTRGEKVPEPMAVQDFSGTFKVRIPAALHRRLVMEAADSALRSLLSCGPWPETL